ncbi:unnamed protein product [Nesidiocoris tenuis]|uniref:Uncharacterized protein n=1 Tax=Nesidiocoris tenuis TaxID=355587 RepID=A0A6H5HQT0_9HEMI|nr:unnamed protein product [Nesidiocoris tenuis]
MLTTSAEGLSHSSYGIPRSTLTPLSLKRERNGNNRLFRCSNNKVLIIDTHPKYILPARFQLSFDGRTENFFGHGEHQVERLRAGNVVFLDPQQTLVELLIQRLDVTQRHRPAGRRISI